MPITAKDQDDLCSSISSKRAIGEALLRKYNCRFITTASILKLLQELSATVEAPVT